MEASTRVQENAGGRTRGSSDKTAEYGRCGWDGVAQVDVWLTSGPNSTIINAQAGSPAELSALSVKARGAAANTGLTEFAS